MTAPRLPPRTPSFPSQDNVGSPNAALRGATTAFGRPSQRASGNSSNGLNGALAAASNAGGRRRSSNSEQWRPASPSRSLVRTTTGESVRSTKSDASRQMRSFDGASMPNLNLPPPLERGHSKSPSQHAAFVAVTNASSPAGDTRPPPRRAATTKRPSAPPKPRRLSSYGSSVSRSEKYAPTDSTSIPPTTSLVDLFEQKSNDTLMSRKRPDPIVIKPSIDLPLESPKPIRSASGITSMIQMQIDREKKLSDSEEKNSTNGATVAPASLPSALSQAPALSPDTAPASSTLTTAGKQESLSPAEKTGDPTKSQPTTRGRTGPETTYLQPLQPSEPRRGRPGPSPSPLRNSTTEPIPIQNTHRTMTAPTESFSPSSPSLRSLPAQYNLLHPRKQTPHMTGDQLANAIVASSLASSRQASPARPMDPPPQPTRQKHHMLSLSRTPSPSKTPGLKKTLRATTQSDVSDDDNDNNEGLYPHSKRKVQKRLGKHPNKHHEGDRKRWRESVTERERKRYEGVWAANKGLYASFTAREHAFVARAPHSPEAQDLRDAVVEQVSNLIVRDVWSRSRLPDAVLETVWDLVDNNQVGRLSKEEFVVGLWLIDGRLKGKKLPVKVSDSVWRSVKGLQGIKIKK